MFTALEGIKILDLSNVLAGPFCCHQLVHMGAEVIKVEVPNRGDLARQLGADAELNSKYMGISFLAQNAGKKSITLNLKDVRGKELLKKLVKVSDVVVENFRPGVMERLGVSYNILKEVNPNIIYCAITGFGQDGPMKNSPAYDQIIQGVSGVMSITGDKNTAPYRVGYPVCDSIGGLTAAMAICGALVKDKSERGAYIDVSMLEATIATMGWVVSNWLVGNVLPKANGNENFSSAPSGTFETKKGGLNIAANKQEQWEIMCEILGCKHLQEHPDFKLRDNRKINRHKLNIELKPYLMKKSAKEWVEIFNKAGVPTGEIYDVVDILNHSQIADRGMIAEFDKVDDVGGDVKLLRTGFKVDGDSPDVKRPPVKLGYDNDEIFGRLGLSKDEFKTLKDDGVI